MNVVLIIVILSILLLTSFVIYILFNYTKKEPRIVERHSRDCSYTIYEIHNLLTHIECDDLIQEAKTKGLDNSMVWNYKQETGNTLDEKHRQSKQTWLRNEDSEIANKISDVSVFLTKLPKENQESLQVANYERFGKFNTHFDACTFSGTEYCKKMNHNAGQRRTTLLIYLNDDFIGGETEFTEADIIIKPKKGKGILFWDTNDKEEILPLSKHRGNEVRQGEKWISTKWTHSGVYI
jgi:prolyl 4-hydroxylase